MTIVGSVNIDLVCYLDRWPEIGETIPVRETATALGGKGANQAVAAKKLGADVTLVAAIGQDAFGQSAAADLKGLGVTCRLAQLADHQTGLAFIDVGPDGNNLIRLSAGANAALRPADAEQHADLLQNSSVVLLQNEIALETSLAAARLARQGDALVIMDPAPAPAAAWGPDVLAAFDILTPNASEAGSLLGRTLSTLEDALAAADTLAGRGLKGAVVTMGGHGVAWSFGNERGMRTAPKVAAIDTVAAGDCFNGALAAELARGSHFEEAIAFAMRAAALATTRKGASSSLPDLKELETFSAVETA
ncbi:ribokinase [Roseibium hamelinense]|uniref:ribokinase n=1 Tax=Roseibium hamelinense TaxID=150831 RepID=UPI001FCC18E8|nr:ribokinase [Roseibium hamelinense]